MSKVRFSVRSAAAAGLVAAITIAGQAAAGAASTGHLATARPAAPSWHITKSVTAPKNGVFTALVATFGLGWQLGRQTAPSGHVQTSMVSAVSR